MTGYLHFLYAGSLSEFGEPRLLPQSHGWILERQIPGFASRDAMSCYPLFSCANWIGLEEDLNRIGSNLVSLAVVTDPFGSYDPAYLRKCFKDIISPFKEHFVVDLSKRLESFVSGHHRRNALTALRKIRVERCENPIQSVDEWISLYDNLIARHNIRGIRAFSREVFAKQFNVPGLSVFKALHKENTIGMTLWFTHRDIVYYHLGAYSKEGYELRASFGLFWSAVEYFITCGYNWLDLGAGSGVSHRDMDGLARFKHGWSTGTQTAYFCGRIFNQRKYLEIVEKKNISEVQYFPAYRLGEFD